MTFSLSIDEETIQRWKAAVAEIESMEKKRKESPECRWCHGGCRPLSHNGVIGPGCRVHTWVCNDCGKVQ